MFQKVWNINSNPPMACLANTQGVLLRTGQACCKGQASRQLSPLSLIPYRNLFGCFENILQMQGSSTDQNAVFAKDAGFKIDGIQWCF